MDKVERSGIRTCDMLNIPKFIEKLSAQIDWKNEIIQKLYGGEPLDKEAMVEEYVDYAKRLAPSICDTSIMVYEAVKSGKKVLFEGAQGSMLDIDLGTYPYVTSSHPISGGFTTGSGIGVGSISEVVGIVKAYTTRVGKGPFVTELLNETGDRIREIGHEYGTTTGRARRIGRADLPATLLTLEGAQGTEHWIGFKNFWVITRYNRSPMYAMAVWQLSQEIAQRAGALRHHRKVHSSHRAGGDDGRHGRR